MPEIAEPQESLVLWCSEFYEKIPHFGWIELARRVIPSYLDAVPPKPTFYAPTDAGDMSNLYRFRPDRLVLIADGEGFQNSHWQIEAIRRQLRERGLRSVEIIGAFPGCVTMVGDELGRDGVTAVVSHVDGRTELFPKTKI